MNFHAEDFYFNLIAEDQNKTQWSLPQYNLQTNLKQKSEDFHGRIMYQREKMKTSIKAWWRKRKRIVVENFLPYMKIYFSI